MTEKGQMRNGAVQSLATSRCWQLLVSALLAGILPLSAAAQIPPPGTVISNSASSTQQVGAALQTANSNSVAVTVGSAAGLPVLTKSFGSVSIVAGASTPLVFRLTNVPGNPAQAGIAFTDNLPTGLRLTAGATSTIASAGCAAVVGLTAPSTISVSAASMTAGTSICDIAINGITNVSAANTDCSANPAAFTNGNTSISGVLNASNGVTNQCLVVNPTLTVTTTPVCNRDTPFVDYNATVLGVGAPSGVTITWQKLSGEVVRVLTGQPLTGRLLWPGAAVDPSGNPVAWPGWSFVEGEWIQVNDGLRPDMRIVFEVNPTSTSTVSYPAATSACNPNPPNSGNVPDMSVMKSISAYQGLSPSGPYTITLRYANAGAENAVKRDVTVSDILPAGMKLIPGSLRISPFTGSTGVPLPAASGTFTYSGSNGRYQASGNSISVSFDSLAQNAVGLIMFDVTIDSGFAVDSTITNTADYVYTRSTGYTIMPRRSNPVVFKVIGTESIILRGMTLPSVDPGSTVSFDNLLTNNTGHTDTFDIALTGSTFPAGTVLKLYKSDGVTLLADNNGNGVVDTGPVASGATYKIVVKAQLPNGVTGGPFSVTKTAKSITNPLVTAADVDVVGAINSLCRVRIEPNNSGSVSPGGSIVYTHVLTNVGNCTETVTIPSGFLNNSAGGWIAQVFLDNPNGGGASIVGVLDSSDTAVTSASTFTVPPGGKLVFLARVGAPANAINGASIVTTFNVLAGSSGNLGVTDTTSVSTGNPSEITDIITGFIDPTFLRPTVWGFIGRPLYLRANAPSCNADPTVIERRTIIITGPNGEREEIIATETGPNTGMFVAEPLNIRLPPVTAGNVVLEGRPYDTYDVDLVGCGKKISTTVTLIDPNGVVFDSRTNQPVAGATVRIFVASGGVCTTTPAAVSTLVAGQVAPAPNVVVTGSDGRYDFPLVAPGDYCVQVTPPNGYTWTSSVPFTQLPVGRNIIATGPTTGGSYGGIFRVSQTTGPVILDIPVDAGLIGGLFAQKTVLRSIVEIGELLDYSVVLKNNTGYVLNQSDVLLTDTLPAGFTYVSGTARKDGVRFADPQGGAGPRLVFNLGHMAKDQQLKITYRVRVGPGAMQGDGVNRVVGSYRMTGGTTLYSESNVATAKVTITGGVFTDRAYIVGKVYADCNKDGVQSSDEQNREVGVPGVRLYLQDGTNVITDAEGKFSFYGLLPRAHVLKVDRTSLPAGVSVADFAPISNRHLGKGDSRLVDLKQGELHKANFAIQTCSKTVLADITERRLAASGLAREIDGRLQQKLETDPNLRASNDVKALPASGSVGLVAPIANVPAPTSLGGTNERVSATQTTPADGVRFDSIAPSVLDVKLPKPIVDRPQREPQIPLEMLLPNEDNSLGFIGIKDGDVMPFAQTTIRVKGSAGATFKLSVNGKDVADDRIGKRAVFAEKQSQAWEYLGVGLAVGNNVVAVKQYDQFGNQRGEKSITIIAPGALAKLVIEFPQTSKGGNVADGKTPAKVVVRLTDSNGIAVTSRTAVTLSTSAGRWNVEDLNSTEPGVQTFMEGGRSEFDVLPPTDPGEALIVVGSGDISTEAKLDFLPDLRELIASGLIEGVLNLRKLDTKGFSPARASDGFEQEITHVARTWKGGERDAAARAAMFLKGKVKGEYLLTLAYDSDKNTRERLFRDIQPDEFYPIYGDSSVRGFDAQSTGRFYVRIDRKKSYLLYGDFNTSQYSDGRKLANYNRSLTGAKYHYESGNVSASVFASRDTTKQVIDELPANGTSGPFVLTRAGGLINSEKIEILTRDRNQPSIILRALPQSRFVDYELEPLTGRILFKAPIASLDENLNPISVRITYEIDQGGNEFWVAGGDVQVKLNERFEVGASLVDDRNPLDKFRMAGINAIARLADKTFLVAELAQTRRELIANSVSQGSQSGNAGRIEFRHMGANIDLTAYAGRAEKDFDNPGSGLGKGRQEIGGRITYKLDEKTRVKGEMLQTEDIVSGSKRDGVLLTVEKTLENGIRVEGGIRHARETQQVQAAAAGLVPNEVTAARVRVTGDVPGVADAAAYVEAEVDVKDTNRKIAAVGADYKLPHNGRLYARHEFISSLTGPYGLNTQQRQNATVVGVSTDYMKNANIFSEYRIRDAISGGDAEAALGLRNTWTLADGLQLQTGFERVHALSGKGDAESTAATFGLEYTANPLWKGSTRLELRTSPNTDSILSTIAGAAKISRDWTFLGRNTYSLQKNKGQGTGEIEQDRMQLGLAYRDTDKDAWNALGRIEHRTENDSTQLGIELKRSVELVSIHANWQPRRPFTFSGRYAAKWVAEKSNGLSTKNTAHLLSGRVIWDIAPRWDISVAASTLLGKGAQSKHYGLGLELGFMVMENLWVSGGYNFFGYRDDDLATGEYTSKGAFVRLRYKFDEDLFAAGKSAKSTAASAAGQMLSSRDVKSAAANSDPKGGG